MSDMCISEMFSVRSCLNTRSKLRWEWVFLTSDQEFDRKDVRSCQGVNDDWCSKFDGELIFRSIFDILHFLIDAVRKCCHSVNFEISSLLVTAGKARFLSSNMLGLDLSCFRPMFHSHNKIRDNSCNGQDFWIIENSLFLEFSKNSMTPPKKCGFNLGIPESWIWCMVLRYLISK